VSRGGSRGFGGTSAHVFETCTAVIAAIAAISADFTLRRPARRVLSIRNIGRHRVRLSFLSCQRGPSQPGADAHSAACSRNIS